MSSRQLFFFNQIKKAHSITKMTLKYLRYYIDTKVKKKKNDSGIAFHDILHMACWGIFLCATHWIKLYTTIPNCLQFLWQFSLNSIKMAWELSIFRTKGCLNGFSKKQLKGTQRLGFWLWSLPFGCCPRYLAQMISPIYFLEDRKLNLQCCSTVASDNTLKL